MVHDKAYKKRQFLDPAFIIDTWESLEPYFNKLLNQKINSVGELEKWLLDRSELESAVQEDAAWRYIRVSCNTTDTALSDRYNYFVNTIQPEVSRYSNLLDKKLIDSPFADRLDHKKYFVMLRGIRNDLALFRESNVPLQAEVSTKEQEYSRTVGSLTVFYNDEEMTLQKAGNLLKEINRDVRSDIFRLINDKRLTVCDTLNELLSQLIGLRQQMALNAGYTNFRDFRFAELGRFDYTAADCEKFHHSIAEEVCPVRDMIFNHRKFKLAVDPLKPWDLQVDTDMKPPLKPFGSIDDLVDKTIRCFSEIKPFYGECIQVMKEGGYFDLASRVGKAPGGYNYPLYETNIPFVFMNATHSLSDVETMMHEGGHAIHSFLTRDIRLIDHKNTPAEIAELASMTMELLAMEHWECFFSDPDELKRARRSQLEGVILTFPWVATVDKFQHWLYTHPQHTNDERMEQWKQIASQFESPLVDWSGAEHWFAAGWQKQIHIFEIPFYYIEYAISQLGAIAIWRNYKTDRRQALRQYEDALSLGYSVTIPEVYKAAGIPFDFSAAYVHELMVFVKQELEKLQ